MTDPHPITTPDAETRLPQLDHDGDRKPGGAKKAPATEWVVTRVRGLHQIPSAESAAVLRAGGRMATDRDFRVAGIEPS